MLAEQKMIMIATEDDTKMASLTTELGKAGAFYPTIPRLPISTLHMRSIGAQRWVGGIERCLAEPRSSQTRDQPIVHPSRFLYCTAPACSTLELFALGSLSGAAVLAVGYSLLCGLGLVGNWSLFQAGIERLVQ